MLADQYLTIDSNDIPIRKSGSELPGRFVVVVGLSVGRQEDSPVDDEIVGIGGGQTLAVVVHGSCHREGNESVGSAVCRTEGFQFLLHSPEVIVMNIFRVVTPYI